MYLVPTSLAETRPLTYSRRVATRMENVLVSALQELARVFGADRVINAAGQVFQTAAQTKAVVDDNVAAVLGLAGLPSKSDVDALRRQLDVLQATLANVSRKLDRLAEDAAQQNHAQGHPPDHLKDHLPISTARRRASRVRPGD